MRATVAQRKGTPSCDSEDKLCLFRKSAHTSGGNRWQLVSQTASGHIPHAERSKLSQYILTPIIPSHLISSLLVSRVHEKLSHHPHLCLEKTILDLAAVSLGVHHRKHFPKSFTYNNFSFDIDSFNSVHTSQVGSNFPHLPTMASTLTTREMELWGIAMRCNKAEVQVCYVCRSSYIHSLDVS